MTATGIANLVLSHLGAKSVTSIDDVTTEAEALRDAWGAVRDGLLRAHRWNFAKVRAYLTPVVAGESFALPADCLRILRVNGVDQAGPVDGGAEIEGKTLRIEADSCEVVYLRIVENVGEWDSLFVLVFGYELAAAVGPRLANGSQAIADAMRARAADQLQIAMAANAIETRPTVRRAVEGSRMLQRIWHGYEGECNWRRYPSTVPTTTTTTTTPGTPPPGALVDPDGNYLVDPDGNYIVEP